MTKLNNCHGEEFGLKQLQKYGWSEGAGLGAREDGMSEPLKPSLKFDKHGLGHDIAKDIAFNWWDDVFNKALNSTSQDGNKTVDKSNEPVKRKKKSYSNFVKKDISNTEDEDQQTDNLPSQINTLSSEMVEECEGRTAHKGARHGVYSSGKLERLARADKEMMRISTSNSSSLPSSKRLKSSSELGPSRRIQSSRTNSGSKRTKNRK